MTKSLERTEINNTTMRCNDQEVGNVNCLLTSKFDVESDEHMVFLVVTNLLLYLNGHYRPQLQCSLTFYCI